MQKVILDTNIIVSALIYFNAGNILDFQITEFEYTRILTPREYWNLFEPKK